MLDEWKDIPGFEGYQANYEGQVRRVFASGSIHYLTPYKKPRSGKAGRLYVKLSRNNRPKEMSLTTVIASTFLGPRPEGHIPVHINGNITDNCAGNIEYITYKESGKRYGTLKKNRRSVVKVDKQGNIVEIYSSAAAASRDNYISLNAIVERCHKRVKNPYDLDGYNYLWDSDSFYK